LLQMHSDDSTSDSTLGTVQILMSIVKIMFWFYFSDIDT
jgi:hypothetical protein